MREIHQVPGKGLSLFFGQKYTGVVSMETGFLQVLLNPARFFEARMQDEPSLKVPALIALVCGLIGAVSALMMADLTTTMLPAEMEGLGGLMVAFSVAVAFIGGFLAWIIYGFIFHLISMVFKGQGSLNRTLEFTGYGLIPQVFGGIIGAIFSYYLLSGLTIPAMSSTEEIVAFSEYLATVLTTDPLAQVAGIVSILFLIWSANIWIFGMKYARNLSTRDAVLTVGIPVGIYVIYLIITLLGWL